MLETFKFRLRSGLVVLARQPALRRRLRHILGDRGTAVARKFVKSALGGVVLRELSEVDAFLDGMRSDMTEAELRSWWDRHTADREALFGRPCDAEPHGEAYRAWVAHQYAHLSGRNLDAYENERTLSIDPAQHLARPFPYDMHRPGVSVAHMLYTFARIFALAGFSSGQRLIEFGSGWGNAVFQFAQAGLHVTLVDIEKNFLDLARERFTRLGMQCECLHGEFNDVELPAGRYDYAFFMSAFHHCLDHAALLRSIHRALTPEGRIIFCGEPILPDFDVPWGVRLDGESLWAVRRNGWLELGFREDYFRECLFAAGFTARRHTYLAEKGEVIWIAEKTDPANPLYQYAASLAGEDEAYTAPTESHLGTNVFLRRRRCTLPLPGPDSGAETTLSLVNFLPAPIRVRLSAPGFARDITFASGQVETLRLPSGKAGEHLTLETDLLTPPRDGRALGIALIALAHITEPDHAIAR